MMTFLSLKKKEVSQAVSVGIQVCLYTHASMYTRVTHTEEEKKDKKMKKEM